jgi:hypothetical protein
MKRALLTIVLLSTCFAATVAQARIITIRLPALATSGDAEVGLYENGYNVVSCLRSVYAQGTTITVNVEKLARDCSSGEHDFRSIQSVRVLLLVPGYAAATLDTETDDSPIWAPELVKLPVAVIEGRIDPAPKIPIRVSLSYSLIEAMGFFFYFDGGTPDLELGTAFADAQGHFKLKIPDITSDPFIQGEGRLVEVRLNSPDHPEPGEALSSQSLELRQLYSSPPLVLRYDRDRPSNPADRADENRE